MADLTVANTIIEQLGGRMFRMMTGAKDFVGGDTFLVFSIPPNQSKARKVRITLMPSDTYKVEFFRLRSVEPIAELTHNDIYCDVLQETFTRTTGLYTRL